MRYTCTTLTLLALFGPNQMPARGNSITTLYSTGQGLPTGVTDPNYTIISAPPGAILNPGGATDTVPPGGRSVGPPAGTQWIGPNISNAFTEPAGNYDFQTEFSLAGFDPSTAIITGAVSSDNTLFDIMLNNVSLGISGGTFTGFLDYTISSGFLPGENTLDFIVTNGPARPINPVALLVSQSGTATAVPEPSSLVPAVIGGVVLGYLYCFRPGQGNLNTAGAPMAPGTP